MKTFVPFKSILTAAVFFVSLCASAQNSQKLIFKNATLESGSALSVNAIYRFSNVGPNTDALLKIDSVVGGAEVKKIDDDSGGLGYLDALQPEIKIPNGTGTAYAVFTITFVVSGTNVGSILEEIRGTALDIDGNAKLKEFAELGLGGGTASYQTGTLDISITQLLLNKFKALNILGIERDGIDTSALGNMFTVTKGYVSSFTVKFGAVTVAAGSANRQFSLYMKGFNYINTSTLPIKLKSFDAYLKTGKRTELKWVTSAEMNVSHFMVERSLDGSHYTDAGLVFAFGNSTDEKTYSLTDNIEGISQGIIYYRLRSVDNDGKSQLSEVRIIKLSESNPALVTIMTYPNPVSSELRVTIPSAWQNKQVMYEVFSANGKTVKSSVNMNSSQTETIAVGNLSAGMYIVRVSCNGETAQQKIIKQ